MTFESFVNSERCKTVSWFFRVFVGLRALLIQKDVKQNMGLAVQSRSLRALLIQKDVKPSREVIA